MNRYLDIAPEVKEALDAGKPVCVTQAALDAVARKQIRWELVVHTKALTQFMQKFFLYIIRLNRHSAFSFPSQ